MKTGLINLLICFGIAVAISPFIIRALTKLKFGQSILVYVEKHKGKSGTPTMGGIVFILASVCGYFMTWQSSNTLATICILSMVFFGVIGLLDDFIKIKYKHNAGLSPIQKLLGQVGIATALSIYLYYSDLVGSGIVIPFGGGEINLGVWIIPICIFVYLAIVNSVNLIDGLDGLCAGVSATHISIFTIILFMLSSGFDGLYLEEMTSINILSMGVVGALIGFLLFNVFPAKVFMGDTGSLALGGYIASLVVTTRNYILFLIIGLAYVLTALSVVIQVGVFKLTHKRVFKMAPLHHHFEQSMHENRVVFGYVISTIIIGIITIILYM